MKSKMKTILYNKWKDKYNNGYINPNKGKEFLRGIENPLFGKPLSEETKKKLSISAKERGIGYHTSIKISIDNIEYSSITDASRKLSINRLIISKRVKSNDPKFSNYIYL